MTMRVRLFCIYFRKGVEKNNHVILLMIIYLVKYIVNNYIAI